MVSRLLVSTAVALLLSACAEAQFLIHTAKTVKPGEQGGNYKVGQPYQIDGVWYYPRVDYGYDESGIASWYGPQFHGKSTANGESFDMNAVTAAHRTLPLPSLVRVTNLENGRSLVVRVNDRGPYARGRIIDMSRRSAQLLGFEGRGTARVRVQIMAEESRVLAARVGRGQQVAQRDGSMTVASLPKPTVSAQELPPPGGASPQPPPQAAGAERRAAIARERDVEVEAAAQRAEAKIGRVAQEAPKATRIYIQAGAFREFQNAHRVQAILSGLGPAKVSPVLVNGIDLFRVRLGPIAAVDEADKLLDSVVRSGYPDARIVVD